MAEYINAIDLEDFRNEIMNAFISLCNYNDYNKLTLLRIGETIDRIYAKYYSKPLADVVEVRHGEWVRKYGTYGEVICSACKTEAELFCVDYEANEWEWLKSTYCPHCGAKMDRSEG